MLDLDGAIQYVNAAFSSINRLTRDEAVGRSYFDFIPANQPRPPSVNPSARQDVARRDDSSLTGRRPVELESRFLPLTTRLGASSGGW